MGKGFAGVEVLPVEEGIILLGKGVDHKLVELFHAYCSEAEALTSKIEHLKKCEKKCKEARKFRLLDLKQRLIPEVGGQINNLG